jgi:DNA modification methylase
MKDARSGRIFGVANQAWLNNLYYGDNLDVMRENIPADSIDLVYLDPPFNSNRNYNVIFGRHTLSGNGAAAQIQAFDDTWHWTPVTDQQYQQYVGGELPARVGDALIAFRTLLGENDAMAYLVNMAPRLTELHRVLKNTGSLYLHCDPTMSHYLRVLLDAIFEPTRFRNEIVWKRSGSHGSAKRFGPLHDIILFYSMTDDYTWNPQYAPYDETYVSEHFGKEDDDGLPFQDIVLTGPGIRSGESGKAWKGYNPTGGGRHWALPGYLVEQGIIPESKSTLGRLDALDQAGMIYWTRNKVPRLKFYLSQGPGVPQQDVWNDIAPINSQAAERLGYPTQKPLALLERIIFASSNDGDIVLDPFCGCGTAVDAAQRLGRKWIGIDITYIAVDLIEKRLQHTFGPSISGTYDVLGIPRDLGGAQALFDHSAFDFERWAVSQVGAQPNEKQVGDKGVDGVARFYTDTKGTIGKLIVSVKGGKTVTPAFVRELSGTVQTQKAQMGVLIIIGQPSKGVRDEADHGGTYTWPANNTVFPRIQVITVEELLRGVRPKTPALNLPYIQARRAAAKPWVQDMMPEGE